MTVPILFRSPGVIPRNIQLFLGFTEVDCFRNFCFSNETSAPESTKNEQGLSKVLIERLTKFEAATLIEKIDPPFLKNFRFVVA